MLASQEQRHRNNIPLLNSVQALVHVGCDACQCNQH
jgi:hypothetical protein